MIKILIVDGHPIIQRGLAILLEKHPEFNVVGSVSNGIEIFEFIRRYPVDIVISEIDLPELNGITALRAIKKEHQNLKVIMFSHHPEEIYAISVLKAGASAYISKSEKIETLEKAIKKVYEGNIYLSERMSKHLKFDDTKKSINRLYKKLSVREVEVLRLLSSGKKNKEIARELNINEKTVSTYKSRLYKKLNVNNLVDLIEQAKQLELS